jgi:hypothetical protein
MGIDGVKRNAVAKAVRGFVIVRQDGNVLQFYFSMAMSDKVSLNSRVKILARMLSRRRRMDFHESLRFARPCPGLLALMADHFH